MRSPFLCCLHGVEAAQTRAERVLHHRRMTGCPGFIWRGHNASSALWVSAGTSSEIAPWISSASRSWHFRGAKSKSRNNMETQTTSIAAVKLDLQI